MNIGEKVVWQHAAGDTDRSYAGVCLAWDVILNGPGYTGPWNEGQEELKNEGWSNRKLTDLRRFAEEMADGDIVVLRLGTSEVRGVGEIVGGYEWSDIFGDVDGWELQHLRRVRWIWKCGDTPPPFPTYSMKLGDTTQRLTTGPVLDWIKTLDAPTEKHELAILPPADDSGFSIEELSDFLFDHGVASASIENLLKEIGELTKIAKWYKKFDNPSESETVSYLVVPLFRALGWTPQKMAIEWNRVDLALFNSLPRSDDRLTVVVEVKKKGNSCLTAVSQAQSYAELRPSCHRLIVTDGIRFGVYTLGTESFELYAYMNLTRLRNSCPIYQCRGVKEAILGMTPEWTET